MNDFSRLLYIGDVPVEMSYHGSALLYRLLETYPARDLGIIEAGMSASLPERRLAGVNYHSAPVPLSRLQTTRFAPWYAAASLMWASSRAAHFNEVVKRFRPEAFLTVTHGYSWLTAATIAGRLCVPLHLVCHDEWARTLVTAGGLEGWKDRVFGKHYRAAASRLCVSPFMARDYERRYGVRGSVLYPSRAAGAEYRGGSPKRFDGHAGPFTIAFAGTINSAGMVAALKLLAESLREVRGKLVIFGPLVQAQARVSGLAADNIELGGLLPSEKLIEELRDRADALFVPMSFDAEDRANMEISFPSKLTDYTAVGLPLLIYGPPYCSAVRWANENNSVAVVVAEENGAALSGAITQLAADPLHQRNLAEKALEVGHRYFTHAAALEVFHAALHSPRQATRDPGATALAAGGLARPR